jgi:hypothetical protein
MAIFPWLVKNGNFFDGINKILLVTGFILISQPFDGEIHSNAGITSVPFPDFRKFITLSLLRTDNQKSVHP